MIDKAAEVYEGGEKYLVIDMSGVPFMGSTGLVALYSVAKMQGASHQRRRAATGPRFGR